MLAWAKGLRDFPYLLSPYSKLRGGGRREKRGGGGRKEKGRRERGEKAGGGGEKEIGKKEGRRREGKRGEKKERGGGKGRNGNEILHRVCNTLS